MRSIDNISNLSHAKQEDLQAYLQKKSQSYELLLKAWAIFYAEGITL